MRISCHYVLGVLCLIPGARSLAQSSADLQPSLQRVDMIPLPAGYERVIVAPGSFAEYLRQLPLRKDNTVYLYNGQPKKDQSLHYAVIDISTGKKDLQQCADLVMRLRAEYFYSKKMYDSIVFASANTPYRFRDYCRVASRECLMHFMEQVFLNCGTYSLEKQLRKTVMGDMRIGDVFIKGGAPGHAEIVIDMAINKQTGDKLFMLAEGYMPAQDAHIVRNPLAASAGPWYGPTEPGKLVTATWVFETTQLKTW